MAQYQTAANNSFRNQPVKLVTASSNAATIDDSIINVNFAGAVSITIPTATTTGSSANSGKTYTIKDISGAAGTNNITVSVVGGGNIDGSSTAVINSNYGALELYSSGSSWYRQAVATATLPAPVYGSYVATTAVTPASGSSTANASTFMFVTIPTSGTWEITYIVRAALSGSNLCSALFSGGSTTIGALTGGSLVPNSELLICSTSGSSTNTATGDYILTTGGATIYVCGVYAPGTAGQTQSDSNGRSRMIYNKLG